MYKLITFAALITIAAGKPGIGHGLAAYTAPVAIAAPLTYAARITAPIGYAAPIKVAAAAIAPVVPAYSARIAAYPAPIATYRAAYTPAIAYAPRFAAYTRPIAAPLISAAYKVPYAILK